MNQLVKQRIYFWTLCIFLEIKKERELVSMNIKQKLLIFGRCDRVISDELCFVGNFTPLIRQKITTLYVIS